MVAEFFKVVEGSGVTDLMERARPVRRALERHLIHIQIPSNEPGTPLSGAEFVKARNGKPAFLLKPGFLRLYPRHRSFVFAVLMHETAHAWDYLKSPKTFFPQKEEGIERYLYEMDACYLEGRFLKEVSRPQGWGLSPFETFLVESLEKDNLASFSTALLSVDMDFTYRFYKARRGSEPLKELVEAIVTAGREMRERFLRSGADDAWERYQALVSIRTFVAMGPELAASLVRHKRPETDPADTIERHVPGFDALRLELHALLLKHAEELEYRKELVRRFNVAFDA